MWMAVFADTGVTLLTIINTLRIIKKFKWCVILKQLNEKVAFFWQK
jgi:hypothetical protein